MKIVIAPDSFKESLSAMEAAQAMARGVRQALPDAEIVCVPMGDGGEGTVDAVLDATQGEWRTTQTTDALGRRIAARWGWLPDCTAFIEMAAAAGLEHVAPEDRDIGRASTFGVGETILAALDAGAQRIVIGLGGSATNDGGAGMLQALGVTLRDAAGVDLVPGGAALADLASIDTTHLDARLMTVRVEAATDVDNPLCGESGASAIFGPQKGATPQDVLALDAALAHFAAVCADKLGRDVSGEPGTGAAGGTGFALQAFVQAQFRPGIELVAELTGLAATVADADLVFTGEGRMDAQTLRGKTPAGVARVAQQAGVPVVAIAGSLGPGYDALYAAGLTAAVSLACGPMTLKEACDRAGDLLTERARDMSRLWLAGRSVPVARDA
ncbi:glycerate kinase [Alcaligenaceae bacterium B3P038]|nr:glycerate kinase [Alcaligenaceae bacterium B3P038]